MKLAILVAVGVATVAMVPSAAEAQVQRQLQFFNSCPVPVRYFVAIPSNGAWKTHGWFSAPGGKTTHDLLDRYGNQIFVPEGVRVHYYGETTAQPTVRWAGTVNVNMNGALYLVKPATLSVRGGKFVFGLSCEAQMQGQNSAPARPMPARPMPAPQYGGRPAGPRQGGWAPGARVTCNFKNAGTYYPGRITQIGGTGSLYIQYDDGDREWTHPNNCRAI